MRTDLLELSDADLIKAVQHGAAYRQPPHWWLHYRAKEYLMIFANIALNFYSADAFTKNHLPDNAVLNDMRLAVLIVLGAGTFIGNFFSKIPMLTAPINGMGFTAQQKRVFRAIEVGVQKCQLVLHHRNQERFQIVTSLVADDWRALGENGCALTQRLLQKLYGIEFVLTRVGDQLSDVEQARGSESIIEIAVDHQGYLPSNVCFKQSALNPWQTLRQHPGWSVYYALKWLVIRGGSALSIIFSINHSIHNVAQSWFGFSDDSGRATAWALIATGLALGWYRALSNNSLIVHKFYQEVSLLDARRQLAMKPKLHWKPLLLSAVPLLISFFFNTSMGLFFGKDGFLSLCEQFGWATQGKVFEAPSGLGNFFSAWFLVTGLLTAWSSTMTETYRKIEAKTVGNGETAIGHASANPTGCLWAMAMFGIVADSMNYGLVGSNSSEQAYKKMIGALAALVLAGFVGVGVTVVSTFWSYSTLKPKFSGTVEGMRRMCCRRTEEGLDQQAVAGRTRLLQ